MASNASGLLMDQPFRVPDHIGRVDFYVVTEMVEATDIVSAFALRSPVKVGLRFSGGVKNQSHSDRVDMVRYFEEGCDGLEGFVSSGATRETTPDGLISPTVCEVPAALVANNPTGIVSLSTLPRVGKMQLVDDSRVLVADQWGDVHLNPGVHCIVMVQARQSSTNLGWDGDIPEYLQALNTYHEDEGWPFAMPVWNGGDATLTESISAARDYSWRVMLVEGSNRAADWLAHYIRTGVPHSEMPYDPELSAEAAANFRIVHRDDPQTLRAELVEARILRAV